MSKNSKNIYSSLLNVTKNICDAELDDKSIFGTITTILAKSNPDKITKATCPLEVDNTIFLFVQKFWRGYQSPLILGSHWCV